MKHTRNSGFTLIETILYIALATVVLYVASGLYSVMITTQARNSAMTDVTLASEHAMMQITQTIRDARNVTDPGVGLASTELVLEMHDDAPYPTETVTLQEGVIYLQDGSQPPVALTPASVVVDELWFTSLSSVEPQSIRISFTAASNASDLADLGYSETFYATATIRE